MHIGGGLSRLRTGVRTVHLAEILAPRASAVSAGRRASGRRRDSTFLGMPHRAASASGTCAATSRSRPPPARALADAQLRRNLGNATAHHPRQAGRGRRRAARLGGAARRRRGDQGRRPGRLPRRYLVQLEAAGHRARRHRALGPRRRRGQPDRHRAWSGRPAPTRSSRSSRWPPRRSGSTRRSRRPASPPVETDLAELIVQLGARPAVAHPGAGDPPQPRRDPRDLPARDARRATRR